uniref:Uncharacterized protein n=1 Tax=Oryza nivara TaxID=4536 RepID=A0A0E0ISM8_ORYNI
MAIWTEPYYNCVFIVSEAESMHHVATRKCQIPDLVPSVPNMMPSRYHDDVSIVPGGNCRRRWEDRWDVGIATRQQRYLQLQQVLNMRKPPSSSSILSLLPSPSLSGKQQQHVVDEQQQQVAGSSTDRAPTPFTVVCTKDSCSAALCPTPKIKSHRRQEIQLAHDDDSHHADDDHDDNEGGAARKQQLLRAGEPAADGLHHGPALERHHSGGSRHKLRRDGGGDGLAAIAGLGIPRRRSWPSPPSLASCCCRRHRWSPAAVVSRREMGKGEEKGWRKRMELTVTAMDGKCDGSGMGPISQSSSGTQQIL